MLLLLRGRGLAARVPHAPHISVPRQTFRSGSALTPASNGPPSYAVGGSAEAEAARLLLQLIVVEFAGFCFLPPSSAPDALLSPEFFFQYGGGYIGVRRARSQVESRLWVPEDVSHYAYDALEVAADGGAARIAEGEEW
jgi:hypothetical protein